MVHTLCLVSLLLGHLRHTHVWISFGPFLESIFASPAQHQIHQSRAPRHVDKNFAQFFSFLDGMLGTLYVTGPRSH
jgi:sterol desaturase/sphingolipid hydroxylase (fatty acid hydroxylase superfamily)